MADTVAWDESLTAARELVSAARDEVAHVVDEWADDEATLHASVTDTLDRYIAGDYPELYKTTATDLRDRIPDLSRTRDSLLQSARFLCKAYDDAMVVLMLDCQLAIADYMNDLGSTIAVGRMGSAAKEAQNERGAKIAHAVSNAIHLSTASSEALDDIKDALVDILMSLRRYIASTKPPPTPVNDVKRKTALRMLGVGAVEVGKGTLGLLKLHPAAGAVVTVIDIFRGVSSEKKKVDERRRHQQELDKARSEPGPSEHLGWLADDLAAGETFVRDAASRLDAATNQMATALKLPPA